MTIDGSDVLITLAADLIGPTSVRYALDYQGAGRSVSQEGGGNLRDSAADEIWIEGTRYQLFNPAPAFELDVVRLGE